MKSLVIGWDSRWGQLQKVWADAIPGDLVFYDGDSHDGIVVGRDEDGNLLIVHCASSYNCVVITGASGFTSIGRPMYYAAH